MTNDPPPRFDPRFNPAFQPGFDPGADDADSPPRRPMSRPKTLAAVGGPQPVPSASPVRARPVTNPGVATGLPERVTGGGTNDHGGGTDDHGGDTDDDAAFAGSDAGTARHPLAVPVAVPLAAQLRNPFLAALAGLAVVLIGVGVWLFSRTYAAFNDAGSFSTQGDFVALETVMRTSPFIIMLGIAIAVGVVFLLAVGWRPRK